MIALGLGNAQSPQTGEFFRRLHTFRGDDDPGLLGECDQRCGRGPASLVEMDIPSEGMSSLMMSGPQPDDVRRPANPAPASSVATRPPRERSR